MKPQTGAATKMRMMKFIGLCLALALSAAYAQAQPAFFPNGTYDPAIPSPEAALGFASGERPARSEEVLHYFQLLAEKSPRLRLVESGRTHENRKLYYALISSEENLARLESIREAVARLADPRTIKSDAEAREIAKQTPAIAWMMYSIHGDELSGVDAALLTAYQLVAGTDTLSERLRRELVVGIDPNENPDGRERFLAQMQQWGGKTPTSDAQSIQHTGVWPWGRGNHYLFDLNRDWFILSQPESRARVQTLLHWNPQLVVDAHEMGSYETYLFPPAREPLNPNIHQTLLKWGKTFSDDQARAFDRYGWSYYTREWHEDWYPGYGSSWPNYLGAVGILYEQASTEGTSVKRPDGTTLAFREAVHHQFVSSLANLATAARHRGELLQDFYRMKKEALAARSAPAAAYYILPGSNPSRVYRLLEKLLMQKIEIETAQEDFQASNIRGYWDSVPISKKLPKGTFIIRLDQPLRPLINAILEFDPRMTGAFLKWERESLERGQGTRMYEVGAWSMLLAYGVEAYVSGAAPSVKTRPLREAPKSAGAVINPQPLYGYLIDYGDDHAAPALLRLLESGYRVRAAREVFRSEGKFFPRGSLLLRLNENPASLAEALTRISKETGAAVYGTNSARSQEGPDLGGGEFELLEPPRVALLAGPDINMYSFGATWYLLDCELGARHSILNYQYFAQADLRTYNVLILPATWGGAEDYQQIFGKEGIRKLKEWIAGGGTLITMGNGAAFAADSASGLSQVKLRRQALKELALYQEAVAQERQIGNEKIDSLAIWEGKIAATTPPAAKEEKKSEDLNALERLDERQRLFMPRGAILRVDLNETHWLSFGIGARTPALLYSSYALMSKNPVETAGRFGEAEHLRLAGLLWPEARQRWANSAYATREALGNGQVILFAEDPHFRAYFYGAGRMLLNALLLGPGFGTRQAVEW